MRIKVSENPVAYPEAVSFMEDTVAAIRSGQGEETVWLLEHPSLYTAGTSAKAHDLLDARFSVYETGRGGQYTYHGPGQRVAYAMLDLKKRQEKPDIRQFVWQLEEWIIRTLSAFDIIGERREGRVGIWVDEGGRESKIAALGVRVRHWVTYHGVSINLEPDLSHFGGIVPCGLSQFGVTSINNLRKQTEKPPVTMAELDKALVSVWPAVFGQD